ncbi:hypothetical protein F5Y10DRAFT_285975 [Nemania abortiva]|nr:hypothetical protein F5Y10DRAFT_285975 [Nemania abortiva]
MEFSLISDEDVASSFITVIDLIVFHFLRFPKGNVRDGGRGREVLEALALVLHRHIVLFLHYWAADSFLYILFPLATGDLYTFLRGSVPPLQFTEQYIQWVIRHLQDLYDALKYIHDYAKLRS